MVGGDGSWLWSVRFKDSESVHIQISFVSGCGKKADYKISLAMFQCDISEVELCLFTTML